jgi:hypothetical protein
MKITELLLFVWNTTLYAVFSDLHGILSDLLVLFTLVYTAVKCYSIFLEIKNKKRSIK